MNTIYSLIHRNLKRMLVVSLGAAGAVLTLYTFFSFKQTESQAVRFVTNHIVALAQAGVNSQNINEIDKEIGRFTQTWKETQDLDLRVDVFLDDKLISHGGQLHPFRYFYSQVEETIPLPSGQALQIKVEIGLQNFLISGALLLLCFAAFILGVFSVLMKSMRRSIKGVTKPLESRIDWLKAIAKDLPASAHQNQVPTDSAQIVEINHLGNSIGALLKQIVMLEDNLMQAGIDKGRIAAAEQVAHSIKGVMATLQLTISSISHLSEREKREINACVGSLRDISLNLLRIRKNHQNAEKVETVGVNEPIHLLPVVSSVIAAKRAQHKSRSGLTIGELKEVDLLGAFAKLSAGELQSILASLIDNAVEAIETHDGRVEFQVVRLEDSVELSIKDSGKGIPADVLPRLMKEGATFGKKDGNGLGLFHAKVLLESIGGKISISSIEHQGTSVTVTLPLTSPPHGFLERIEIPKDADLVIVDDDPLVHQAWKQKLSTASVPADRITHFSSARSFEEWFLVNGHAGFGERVYFFDYDLKAEKSNGLDLIERHSLAFESILISGVADSKDIRERAARLGTNWLSKEFLGVVPISILKKAPETASSFGALTSQTKGVPDAEHDRYQSCCS